MTNESRVEWVGVKRGFGLGHGMKVHKMGVGSKVLILRGMLDIFQFLSRCHTRCGIDRPMCKWLDQMSFTHLMKNVTKGSDLIYL